MRHCEEHLYVLYLVSEVYLLTSISFGPNRCRQKIVYFSLRGSGAGALPLSWCPRYLSLAVAMVQKEEVE